jgi:hypothetical protein
MIGERRWSHGSNGSTKSCTSNVKRLDARETIKDIMSCLYDRLNSSININHNDIVYIIMMFDCVHWKGE